MHLLRNYRKIARGDGSDGSFTGGPSHQRP
jgi:hypothetical protein